MQRTFSNNNPAAAEAVKKNLHVDDSLNSADDENEAIALRQDLTELMKRGGFMLMKWLSNSQAVMKEIRIRETPNEGIQTWRLTSFTNTQRTL